MKETFAQQAERYKTLYEANSKEVTRLSDVVQRQAEQIHHMGLTLGKWEQRFDRLLELRR